jgi:hypothetical protein
VSDILDFRRRLAAVVNDVLVGAVPAAEDALALADQARELLTELHALREGHRPGTRRLVERVRRLEHDLRDRDPALRRRPVGNSRTTGGRGRTRREAGPVRVQESSDFFGLTSSRSAVRITRKAHPAGRTQALRVLPGASPSRVIRTPLFRQYQFRRNLFRFA